MKMYHFKKEDGKFALVYCPKCFFENYALAVLSGQCINCGFDINKDKDRNKYIKCLER